MAPGATSRAPRRRPGAPPELSRGPPKALLGLYGYTYMYMYMCTGGVRGAYGGRTGGVRGAYEGRTGIVRPAYGEHTAVECALL